MHFRRLNINLGFLKRKMNPASGNKYDRLKQTIIIVPRVCSTFFAFMYQDKKNRTMRTIKS